MVSMSAVEGRIGRAARQNVAWLLGPEVAQPPARVISRSSVVARFRRLVHLIELCLRGASALDLLALPPEQRKPGEQDQQEDGQRPNSHRPMRVFVVTRR